MELTANYGLVLPKNYVSIDSTEMEYVDGGGTITLTFSRDFLRDCVTAGTSFLFGAIFGVLGNLGTTVLGIICGALGAALGWIIGGSIARSCITSDKTIGIYIPFIKSFSRYIP